MIITGCRVFIEGSLREDLEVGIRGPYIDRIGERIERYGNEEVIRCKKDSVLLPGFNDAHTHLAMYGLYLMRPRLENLKSPEEALEVIRETVREHEKGELLIFEGFDESEWKPTRLLSREELDKVAPLNPVILRRICGHMAVANSLALALLPSDAKGVDWDSGHMYEWIPLNINQIFPPDLETWKLAILVAQEKMIDLGVTSVTEFGSGVQFKAYEELLDSEQLKVRVNFNFYEKDRKSMANLGLISRFGNSKLRVGGIKVFVDGSVGAGTAAFFKKYQDGKRGRLLLSYEKLKNIFLFAEEHGIQLLIHAIGDRAIDLVLRSASGALKGGNPLRHRIEHAEFISQEQIRKASKLGLYISMQPNFVWRWGLEGELYEKALGKERGLGSNPFKSIIKEGIPLAFGSDAMPPGPLYGIKGAIAHPLERERLTLKEAIAAYTRGGAMFSFEDDLKGEIKKGMFADLVIIDGECLKDLTSRDDLKNFNPPWVIIGGEIVKGLQKIKSKENR